MSRGVEMRTNQTNHSNGMGQGQLKIGAGLKLHSVKYTDPNDWDDEHKEAFAENQFTAFDKLKEAYAETDARGHYAKFTA